MDRIAVAPGTRSGGAALSLREVQRRYGTVHAVQNVSLEVASGEFLTLLGSSGCGKTTTLMLIAGFDMPSNGEILINGRAMTRVPPHLRDQGCVFQHYALFPHMTVRQNLAFPLQVRGIPKREQTLRIGRMLERFRLRDLGERLPPQLSGGQQQRTALARALIHDPPLLLMDEPLAALDRSLRAQLQQEIKDIQREFNVTIIYVTHDQEEAMAMSDRIAVMNHGLLEQVAAPEVLYTRPASEFVARFMGEMNVLEGTVSEQGDPMLVRTDGALSMRVPAMPARELAEGSRVKVTVRPERLRVALARDGSATQWAQARIVKRLYLGEAEKYVLAVGAHTLIARRSVDAGGRAFTEGEHVLAGWSEADLGLIRERAGAA